MELWLLVSDNQFFKNRIMKNTQRVFLIVFSLVACVLELILLVNIFPKTGLGRIIYIPLWIIIFLFISIWLTKGNKPLKKTLINLIIAHLIFFHIMVWNWPQSAAIQGNLVKEFYGKVYE